MNRVTIGTVLALSVATLFTISGCSSKDSPAAQGTLRGLEDDNEISITNSDAGRMPTWVYGSLPVCLIESGQARLTGVRLDATVGVELVSAGVRPLGEGEAIASAAGPLPATYDRIPGAIISNRCEEGPGTDLAIEVKRTTAASGKINSIELTYTQGTTSQKLRYPYSVVLCSGPTATDLPECVADK